MNNKSYQSLVKLQHSFHPLALVCTIMCFFTFTSCITGSHTREASDITYALPSMFIMGDGVKTHQSLITFFMQENPNGNSSKVERLAKLYIEEARLEGVNADVAFAQMCLETGFLRFGGLVTEDMNNFCGLGAIDETQRGNVFETEQEGVRAHIQHLKAYGSTEALNMPLVDPRYKWVNPKGKAPTVHGLAGTWASDTQYGIKLEGLLSRMAWY